MKIKNIALTAVLSALSIVLYEFVPIPIPPTNSPILTLSLGIIPIFFIAYYCGTLYAAISSVLVDLLGYFLVGAFKGYAFNFGYTFNALIGGIIIGLIMDHKNVFVGKRGKIIYIITLLVETAFVLPLFMALYDTTPLIEKYPNEYAMFIFTGIHLIINIVLIIYALLFEKNEDINALNLSFLFYQIIVSLFLTPIWVSRLSRIPYIYYWALRLISVPLTTLIYSLVSRLILIALKKIKPNSYKEKKVEQ